MTDILSEAASIASAAPTYSHGTGFDAWIYLTRKKTELRKTHSAEETEAIILAEDGYPADWSPE